MRRATRCLACWQRRGPPEAPPRRLLAPHAGEPAHAARPEPDTAQVDAATPGTYPWQLLQAQDGRDTPPRTLAVAGLPALQLDIGDGRRVVRTACNRLPDGDALDGTAVRGAALAAARLACRDDRMTQARLAGMLPSVPRAAKHRACA